MAKCLFVCRRILWLCVAHPCVYSPHRAHVSVIACGLMCCCCWYSMHGTSVSVWSCLVALCFASEDDQGAAGQRAKVAFWWYCGHTAHLWLLLGFLCCCLCPRACTAPVPVCVAWWSAHGAEGQGLLVIVPRKISGGTVSTQRASGIARGSCAAAGVGVAGAAIVYRVSVHVSLLIVQRVQCWSDVEPPLWCVLQAPPCVGRGSALARACSCVSAP
jgi:hypothetical protein